MRGKLFAVMLLTSSAYAGHPVTFADVCPGFTISKKGDDLLIRCPGDKLDDPWMTIKDCKNPRARRTATTVTISCDFPPKK